MLLVIKRTGVTQMNHLHYTAKHHHLQYSMTQLKVICSYYYRHYAPKELTQRRNVHYCKVNDDTILVLLVLQAELGIKSQRRFYQLCQVFLVTTGLERTRFYRRARYLIPLLKRIHQGMTSQFHQDDIVIMDSFPIPVCCPARHYKVCIFRDQATISYNPSKKMWFYGFKAHMLVTLSGFIVNYVVTPASVHDRQVAEDLLENTPFPIVLADLGYLSQVLKQHLTQRGYHFWTPLRRNMANAKKHNHWKLKAERRTIETRFSGLCSEFDIERPLARSLKGLELWLEQAIFAYNLRFFN